MTRHWTRREMIAAGATGLMGIAPGISAGSALATSVSLKKEITAAIRHGRPLIAFVSLDGCPHCRLVRNHYLLPLQAGGEHIVEVEMRRNLPMASATGESTTHQAVVQQWAIRVAPTLLFLGRDGVELAARLVGVPLIDFYGSYLDQRIAEAKKKTVAPLTGGLSPPCTATA